MIIFENYISKKISFQGTGATLIVLMVVEIIARIKIESGNDSGCCFPPSKEFPKSLFRRIFRGISGGIFFAWLLFGTYCIFYKGDDGIGPVNDKGICYLPYYFAITAVTIRKIWPNK